MCGIVGYIDYTKNSTRSILEGMVSTLKHRGPDDSGVIIFSTNDAEIGLGHTRLSIIDLSPLGHQPMKYMNYTIILNGEIYNFNEIKEELVHLGYKFNSKSDTEVVLASFAQWGKEAVHKFIGMFAFVIYDTNINKLWLCRDRAGVKPLFYYWKNGLFLFSSELKAFHKHPGFEKSINEISLFNFVQLSYIPGQDTIFKNTFKLDPGCWLEFDIALKKIKIHEYWNLIDYFNKPFLKLNYLEALSETERLILSASQYRMVADVPVGVFLSGGYDSTLVTSLLQTNMTGKLKTFTIGFPDGINEAPYARKVAEILGTDHTEYDCTYNDAMRIIPELSYYFDEPLADISAIPTILVSRLAREKVTVALSADGGDELFAGYFHYSVLCSRYKQIQEVPITLLPLFSLLSKYGSYLMPNSCFHLKHKIVGLSEIFKSDQVSQLVKIVNYARTLSKVFNKNLFQHYDGRMYLFDKEIYKKINSIENILLHIDYTRPLRDCLLVKVDRGTMSASLEGREPLMDHRLAEFAAQLSFDFKYDGQTLKKIVRDITHKYIDKSIMNRPKVGFDLPVFDWLKTDLSYLLIDHLSPSEIRRNGYFNTAYVDRLVMQFKNDRLLYNPVIWRLLIFQMWHKTWMD
jgi:asparagine synthase (glutamine-hydrolysing)